MLGNSSVCVGGAREASISQVLVQFWLKLSQFVVLNMIFVHCEASTESDCTELHIWGGVRIYYDLNDTLFSKVDSAILNNLA